MDPKYRLIGTTAIATSILLRRGDFRRVRYWHAGCASKRRNGIQDMGFRSRLDAFLNLDYTPLHQNLETRLFSSKLTHFYVRRAAGCKVRNARRKTHIPENSAVNAVQNPYCSVLTAAPTSVVIDSAESADRGYRREIEYPLKRAGRF